MTTTTTGPLRGYELAFLETGDTLVRDGGRYLILMWLCRIHGEIAQSARAPHP